MSIADEYLDKINKYFSIWDELFEITEILNGLKEPSEPFGDRISLDDVQKYDQLRKEYREKHDSLLSKEKSLTNEIEEIEEFFVKNISINNKLIKIGEGMVCKYNCNGRAAVEIMKYDPHMEPKEDIDTD